MGQAAPGGAARSGVASPRGSAVHLRQGLLSSGGGGGGGGVAVRIDGHCAMASLDATGLTWTYELQRCCVPSSRSESGEGAAARCHVLRWGRGQRRGAAALVLLPARVASCQLCLPACPRVHCSSLSARALLMPV